MAGAALLQQALALHQQGQLEQARALYRQVLATDPREFNALHLSGVIERQLGDAARAVQLIGQALVVDSTQARAHCNLGAALQDLNATDDALASYETALRLDPRYALAWNNRGNTLRRLGRLPQALESYERALDLQPTYPEAWCHRAIVLNDLGRHADAAASAERALRTRPAYPDALLALGNALQGLHHYVDAVDAYDRALASSPQAEVWCARGTALRKLGDAAAALASYDRALTLRADYVQAVHYRANALRLLGRRDEAIDAYRRARDLGADATEMGFALAALGDGALPSAAPADYIKGLFDQYAGHFDTHLVAVLGYRTPALLEALLARHLPDAHPCFAAALDLGCGTGLCAPFLRPLARTLMGVDLSDNMLDKARSLGLYDTLACADIGVFLQDKIACYELVLAADVFVYFGDLAPVFGQVRRALREGGLFAFSTETLAGSGDACGYAITASNRFAHAPGYLERTAAHAGFTVVETTDAALRREHGADVAGQLVLLRAL
jgi:predicted TPR repeat methyltransferase